MVPEKNVGTKEAPKKSRLTDIEVKTLKDCLIGVNGVMVKAGKTVTIRARHVRLFIDRQWIETPKCDFPEMKPNGLMMKSEKAKIRAARATTAAK